MKRAAAPHADFAPHPRYGRKPRLTGLDVRDAPDGSVWCHWHSPPGVRVPGTAIVADVTRQRAATVQVTHYYDARRRCRSCGRPFLFFAEEQRYWYEVLKFPLESDCLECPPCRRDERQLRRARDRYEALLAATARSEADTLALVASALLLVESGVFSPKLLPRLRRHLKPLLPHRNGPTAAEAKALLSRIAGAARAED